MTENGFGIGARQYEETWISKDKKVYEIIKDFIRNDQCTM